MSVCGTGAAWVKLSGFSREYDYPHYWILPKKTPYYQVQLGRWICLPSSTPTLFNGDFRRPAVVSLLRLHVAPCGSDGILTVSAIAIAVRLRLRTVIVTAAVYWGLNSKLRCLTSPLNLPAPGRRQPIYLTFRFRIDLCFCLCYK